MSKSKIPFESRILLFGLIILLIVSSGCLELTASSQTDQTAKPNQTVEATAEMTPKATQAPSKATKTPIVNPTATLTSTVTPTATRTSRDTIEEQNGWNATQRLLYFKKKEFADVYVETLEKRWVEIIDYKIHLEEDELTIYHRWNNTYPEMMDAELIQIYGFHAQGFKEEPKLANESIISRVNLVAVKENKTVDEVQQNLEEGDEFRSGYLREEWGRAFAKDELHPIRYLKKFLKTMDDPDRYPPAYR